MARIRSIKPELRTSITVSSWPMEVRYFFVLLWGYLDDYGRGVDDTLLIASDCFPRDRDITPDVVDGWLEIMADSGPVCRYEVDAKGFVHCPSWPEHQKPQHPSKPRVPPCPDCEPDPFDEWRAANPPRRIRRSRKSREDLMRVSPARSGAAEKASEMPSTALSGPLGATIIQMPGQMSIDDPDSSNDAGQGDYGDSPEDFVNHSGVPRETLTPEQGAGSREQGAREQGGGRTGAGAQAESQKRPPAAPSRPDGRHPIPDDFSLTPAMRRIGAKTFPGLDLDYELRQFIHHHRGEGSLKRNWPEEWGKWLERSAKWASERRTRAVSGGYRGPWTNPQNQNEYDGELG